MKFLEILGLIVDGNIKQKAIKRFKKEFKTKSIDTDKLLGDNGFDLQLLSFKAQDCYDKIEREIEMEIHTKLAKLVNQLIK